MTRFFSLICALTVVMVGVSTAEAGYLPTKEQMAMAIRLIPTLGIAGEGWIALQVGQTHRPGIVAYSAVAAGGVLSWGLEEWSILKNGKLRKIQWRFYEGAADRQVQEFEVGTKVLVSEGRKVDLRVDAPEVIAASERCWKEIMRAGHPA